jgi:hypothetical protein
VTARASVTEEGIEIDGMVVPFTPENAPLIRQHIHRLQKDSRPDPQLKPSSLNRLRKHFEACCWEISQLAKSPLAGEINVPLDALIVYCCKKIDEIYRQFRLDRRQDE